MKKHSNLIAMGLLSVCCATLQNCNNREEEPVTLQSAEQEAWEKNYEFQLAKDEMYKDSLNQAHFEDIKKLLIQNVRAALLKKTNDIGDAVIQGLRFTKDQCGFMDEKIVKEVAQELDSLHAREPFSPYIFGNTSKRMRAFLKERPQVVDSYSFFSDNWGLKVSPEVSNMRKFYRVGKDFVAAIPPFCLGSVTEFKLFLSVYGQAKGIPFADRALMSEKEIKEVQGQYRYLMRQANVNAVLKYKSKSAYDS